MAEQKYIDDFILMALGEDVGDGDHSSNCSIPENQVGTMVLIAKEEGILAGIDISLRVFHLVDPEISVKKFAEDGDALSTGQRVCELSGKTVKLLQGERLFLNLLQRMCGIATKTHRICKIIEGTSTRLLDTRKTTPNMRYFEKYAVSVGGGVNHRMGLYDMIMLKDNHIDFAGGVSEAISKAKDYLATNDLSIPIEVETRNFAEIKAVLEAGGVQRVMFDNFSVEDTRKAVELVGGAIETESSGGINESNIREYAETGVNFISVGALTHSVKSLDLSLKAL